MKVTVEDLNLHIQHEVDENQLFYSVVVCFKLTSMQCVRNMYIGVELIMSIYRMIYSQVHIKILLLKVY